MRLRKSFHPQLLSLKKHLEQRDVPYELRFQTEHRRVVDDHTFHPLVAVDSGKVIELKFTILTENEAGHQLPYPTGDIDNQLKALLDGLRMPNTKNEIRDYQWERGEEVMFCLMEDDCLVRKVEVVHDKILFPIPKTKGKRDIFVLIQVNVVPKFF